MSTNILLVDGHHVVRDGLACLLKGLESVGEVNQAASGEEALRMLQEGTQANVVVTDLRLQGVLHGIDFASAVHRDHPEVKVLVLSNESRRSMVDAAMQAGARAYLTKSSTTDELRDALRALGEGRTYVGAQISTGAAAGNGHGEPATLRQLSRRERQVLTLIARGGTTKSIADDLGISPKTVEKHRGKLARKLDLHSVAELTRFAIENDMA